MKNMKFWRTALVATLVLTVMLSVTGGTIAWFTDSVESKNNIITAGNLDVELEYSLDGENWTAVDENTEIFDHDELWEPGHVERVALRISNKGSLALKYTLKAKVVEETSSTNVYGETFKLSDYLEVGRAFVQEDGNIGSVMIQNLMSLDRDNFTANLLNIGFDADLGEKEQNLEPGVAHVTALAIYMPTTVGNEANHKTGVDAPSITFGIELEATQYTSESDSFDNQYDKDAPQWTGESDTTWYTEADAAVTEYTLTTAEDLAGLAELVNGGNDFAGKTIKLDANLDLGGKEWTMIGSGATFDRNGEGKHTINQYFKGTFDGQGHTISNLKIDNNKQSYAALFAAAQNATIKNVNVKNVDINADTTAAAILGYAKSATIENCHVSGRISIVTDWAYTGGILAYGYADIKNCSVVADGTGEIKSANRNAVGGIVGWWNENNDIENCKVENLKLTGYANIGAIAGFISGGNKISDCSAKNVILTKTRVDGRASIGLAAGGWTSNTATKTIKNNVFENITLNGTVANWDAWDVMCGSGYSLSETNVDSVVRMDNVQTNIQNNLTVVVVTQ